MSRRGSKSALFLMELIIDILFFAIASAICVQVFVQAHLVSRSTKELSRAAALTESVSAALRAESGDIEKAAAFIDAEADENGMTAYYDKNWESTDAENAAYVLTLTEEEPELYEAAVYEAGSDEAVYSLPIRCHTPLTAE